MEVKIKNRARGKPGQPINILALHADGIQEKVKPGAEKETAKDAVEVNQKRDEYQVQERYKPFEKGNFPGKKLA